MNILFLYARLRAGGSEYHRSKSFTTMLEERHRVQYKYAVLEQEDYERFEKSDPAFPEFLGAEDFTGGRFDAILVDGCIFENPDLPRIPVGCLREFHGKGGIVVFLSDLHDVTEIRNNRLPAATLGEYLGAVLHGDGGPFEESPRTFVRGLRRGDSSLRIPVDAAYMGILPDFVANDIYPGVEFIEAEQPLHLGTGAEWLCIGDDEIQMVTTEDFFSECARPFVFANLSRRTGVTAFFTGLLWRDRVFNRPTSQNARLMKNFMAYVDRHQVEAGIHRRRQAIFISYSHADESLVTRIVHALENIGAEVWLDRKRTEVGTSISAECEAAIRKSDRFLLVLSAASIQSGWVRWEYDLARKLGREQGRRNWLVPVASGLASSQILEVFPDLRDLKYADFSAGEDQALADIQKVGAG